MAAGRLSERRFRELVAEALDGLPEEWGELLDNVAIVVEDEPSADDLAELGMDADEGDELLGLYQGTPL
ncbi:MAG TPA: metallopeptidase family protein, partial [Acidobacteriota bacterium]